jgi:hypothetical protein
LSVAEGSAAFAGLRAAEEERLIPTPAIEDALTLVAAETNVAAAVRIDTDRTDAAGAFRFRTPSSLVETSPLFNEAALTADATIIAVAGGDAPAFIAPETGSAVVGITGAAAAGDIEGGAGAIAADIGLVGTAAERIEVAIGDGTAAFTSIAHQAGATLIGGVLPIFDEVAEPLVGANGAPAAVFVTEAERHPAPALVAEETRAAVAVQRAAEPFWHAELARSDSSQSLDATETFATEVVLDIADVVDLRAGRILDDQADHTVGNRERRRAYEPGRHDRLDQAMRPVGQVEGCYRIAIDALFSADLRTERFSARTLVEGEAGADQV